MLSKTIEYLPLSLITYKGRISVAFRSFGVVPGSFHVAATFRRIFWITNFSKNEFYVGFYYKVMQTLLKSGGNFISK